MITKIVDVLINIDGKQYDTYDILKDDYEFYYKEKVIEGVKNIMGANFSEDVQIQLEQQLPEDNDIPYSD